MRRAALVVLACLSACRSSIDFEQGRPYSCVPDAGGEDALVCGAGWRCGIEGRCHAVGDARAWACRAAVDCEAGWVCGLEQTCHDPAVRAAYRCTDDSHCAAPWRCGYAGRCLDVAGEASPIAETSVEDLTVLGPRFFTGQPDALVAGDNGTTVGIALGGQIRLIRREAGAILIDDFDAGGPLSGLMVDPAGAYAVSDAGLTGFRADGLGSGPLYVSDGGPWLVTASRSYGPMAVIDDTVWWFGAVSSSAALAPPESFAALQDNCLYFANQSGLWVQQPGSLLSSGSALSTSAWRNRSCAPVVTGASVGEPLLRTGGTFRVVLAFAGRRSLGPALPVPDGGESFVRNFVAAIDVTQLSNPARPTDPVGTGMCVLPAATRNSCGEARTTELLDCPSPCEVGDQLTDLRPVDAALEVECTGSLGQTTFRLPYDGQCAAQTMSGRSSRYRELRTPGERSLSASYLVQRGPHGQIWIGDGVAAARPLVLDEPPTALLRPRYQHESERTASPRVASPSLSAQVHPQLGLVAASTPEVLTFVDGTDDWALLRSGNISQLEEQRDGGALVVAHRLAALDALPEALPGPWGARLAQRGDAGLLLASSGDRLYGADEGDWARKVPLRLVPQPGFAILSLALQPGPTVKGYLCTRSAAFAFSSTSELEWSATQIPLPPGQLVEAWTDQGRSRVGYADGRVLTLPSGVPVASGLPGTEFFDYLGACGQIYALTRAGLMRVDGAGRWAPVSLPGGEVVTGETLGGGRLLARDGVIYVFNGSGGGLTFRPGGGCP